MKKMPSIHILIGIGGFLFVLDRIFKFFANHYPLYSHYIISPWLGWEFFGNPGIAFSLPVPQFLVIIGTPIILTLLYYFISNKTKNPFTHIGLLFIMLGAISNLTDRLLFGYTIDYFRIFTSIINIADVMIIAGVISLLTDNNNCKINK